MDQDTIYRCSDGHYYSASQLRALVKSVHVGIGSHFQKCPVDGRWRWARRVSAGSLTDDQLAEARSHTFR